MILTFGDRTWFGISVTYIRFYAGTKAQGINRLEFPFASRLQPYAAYYSAFMTLLICIVCDFLSIIFACFLFISLLQISGWAVFLKDSWDTATFVTNYIPLALFPIFYFSYRFAKRVRSHSASDMDFVTGLDAIEADTYDEEPPKTKLEAFWSWLVCIALYR
jgi:yeast amino acid transporter